MKKVLIVVCLCLLLLSGCGKNYSVAYLNDYPPYIENSDGKVSGEFVDIIKEIAKSQNINIDIKKMSYKELNKAIDTDKVDAFITSRPGGDEYLNTNAFINLNMCVCSTNKDNELKDIAYKKIGILRSSFLKGYLQSIRGEYGFAIIEYDTIDKLVDAIKTGDIDKIVEDEKVVKELSKKIELNIGYIKDIELNVSLSAYTSKSDFIDRFNKGIVDILNSGVYQDIKNRY